MIKLFVFSFLFPFALSAQTLSDIDFGTDTTLDIVTWNIEGFPKNGATTVDSVLKIITSLNADIIACQEINDTVVFNNMVNSLPSYSAIYDPNNFKGLAYIYNSTTVQLVTDYSLFTNGNFWRPFPRAPYFMEAIYHGKSYTLINNHFKCCGDGSLDTNDFMDEEDRRLEASTLLENHISTFLPSTRVVLLGDLNDILTDTLPHNVFQPFYDAANEYLFANQLISEGSPNNWSFPNWPSHLDHILITNELFVDFNHPSTSVSTIRVDDYLPNSFADYDTDISDHRPVGIKLYTQNDFLTAPNQQMMFKCNIFPNPTSKTVNIALEPAETDINITIYSVTGKKMKTVTYPHQTETAIIEITHIKAGVYFILFSSDTKLLGSRKLFID